MDPKKKHETTVEPFHDVVICQPLRTGEIISGTIIVPESEPNVVHALVLAAGPGVYDAQGKRVENPVKTDDVVIFLKSNAFEFWDGGNRHLGARGNMIVGRIKQES